MRKTTLYFAGLCSVFGLLFIACSKGESPFEDNPNQTETPKDDNNNQHSSTLAFEKNFQSPTGFTGYHIALQSDDKIIVYGISIDNNNNYLHQIYRLNNNGSHDDSFDINTDKSWIIDRVTGLFVLADGKVLVGGEFKMDGKTQYLVRLTPYGMLDKTYDSSSYSLDSAPSLYRTGKGKVFITTKRNNHVTGYSTILRRLNNDGTLDESFYPFWASQGTYIGNGDILSVVPLVGGQVLIAGRFTYNKNSKERYDVIELNEDGSITEDFNYTLKPQYLFNRPLAVAVDPQGKIIIAGSFSKLIDTELRDGNHNYNGVARLNIDGSIDLEYKSPVTVPSGEIQEIYSLSDGRVFIKDADKFYYYNAGGGELSGLTMPFPASVVSTIFREKADQYLVLGNITMNEKIYPIARMTYNP